MARSDRRGELQDAAVRVAYQSGLSGLTLAHVAEAAGMPLGGLYYYYKTRDDMVASIVERMEDQMAVCVVGFEAAGGPQAALRAFVGFVLGNREGLMRFGCPIGTLSAQLRKEPGSLGLRMGAVLGGMSAWAGQQFEALGLEPGQAGAQGRMLLVKLEGAAMMAHATGEAGFIDEVVAEVLAQIDRLAASQAQQGVQG
ncbi:TetR/AcrR family transcriptional regulator [Neogemmobacter tilapiae]|uniref:TetR family transcriptional regulator n=1 Tax=Neogemmobacter tilapiae TaxID=875041 RepID=A0A918TGZ9_9RHOB|nr:TetR/AcrR family transcriptional regulator [Gemmobacter tilapiae]GHC46413.1 TetR family transcriptional regulator [Gemmobacter tilapiae]